jgi:type I restriction system specificity protein
MKYIEKLLNGAEVQWMPLGEVFETRNGYTPSKANNDFWTNGDIPWFRMEDIRDSGRLLNDSIQHITPQAIKGKGLFRANSIIMATTATIGEHALLLVDALANQRFTNFQIRKSLSERISPMFAFYYFFVLGEWCKSNVNTSSFPSVDMARLMKQLFPIPPLAVQKEIVRILDKFTTLEAELEAELDCRKRQYEYYRNQLLSLDVISNKGNLNNVEVVTLGEIGTFVRGSGLQKKDFTPSGVGCIHYGQIYTYYGTCADKTKSFVSYEFAQKARKAKTGDLIIATTSENDDDVCKAVVWLGDDEIAVSSDACFYTHKMNPKYVAYYFQTDSFQKQKRSFITGTKVRRVNATDLAKIKIPIPPLAEQQRIVSILDKFEALTTSISEGLPKEIALRRKQYEYYRNQLLSFA